MAHGNVRFLGLALATVTLASTAHAASGVEKEVAALCGTENDFGSPREVVWQRVLALGRPGRDAFLKLARSGSYCGVRWLTDLRDDRVLPIVHQILRDNESPALMEEAALSAVGVFRDSSAQADAIRLLHSRNPGLANAAAGALGLLGDKRSLDELRSVMDDTDFRGARTEVLDALARGGAADAVDLVVRYLDGPDVARYDGLRISLIATLTRIGTPRSRQEALRRFDGFKNPEFRDICARETERILEAQRKTSQNPADLASIDAALTALHEQKARPDDGRQPESKWDELGPLP